MRCRGGYYWCEDCQEPAYSPRCEHGQKHHVRWIMGEPLKRDETAKRREEHTHQFAPVDPERGQALLRQMIEAITGQPPK